jgi:hypothetical protein
MCQIVSEGILWWGWWSDKGRRSGKLSGNCLSKQKSIGRGRNQPMRITGFGPLRASISFPETKY